MKGRRIAGLDAARGAAMLFVLLSHFGEVYFGGHHAETLVDISRKVGMVASPTFVIISGMMLGLLYRTNQDAFGPIRLKLVDRGLFLLIVGHFIIVGSHVVFAGSLRAALHWSFITDTIAICLIAGALLVGVIPGVWRVALGLALFALSWLLILRWYPQATWLNVVKDMLVGDSFGVSNAFGDNFPLVPWFALYFASSYLGEFVAVSARRSSRAGLYTLLGLLGATAVVTAVTLNSFKTLLGQQAAVVGLSVEGMRHFASPFGKNPPSPVYFLFYGGIGLALLLLMLMGEGRPWAAGLTRALSILGRASLFVFILQYYVYFTGFELAQLPLSPAWPVYFGVSVAFIWGMAWLWDRRGYNRYLTLRPVLRLVGVRPAATASVSEPAA